MSSDSIVCLVAMLRAVVAAEMGKPRSQWNLTGVAIEQLQSCDTSLLEYTIIKK